MLVFAADVDRAATYEAAKRAKQYWIGLLLHAHANLINNEVNSAHQEQATDLHLAAFQSPHGAAIGAPALLGVEASDKGLTKDPALITATSHVDNTSPAASACLPARHGARWDDDEIVLVKAMYLAGEDMHAIARKLERKPRSVEIKRGTLAEKDTELAGRLRLEFRLNQHSPS